jgi:hypothetical protein
MVAVSVILWSNVQTKLKQVIVQVIIQIVLQVHATIKESVMEILNLRLEVVAPRQTGLMAPVTQVENALFKQTLVQNYFTVGHVHQIALAHVIVSVTRTLKKILTQEILVVHAVEKVSDAALLVLVTQI